MALIETDYKMRALVTGGAGFIGSALVRMLIQQGGVVKNIDKLTYAANPENCASLATSPNYSFDQIDICDAAEVKRALFEFRPHYVFHLAAETHVDRSIDGPRQFVDSNIVGTNNLLEAAQEYWRDALGEDPRFRFIQVSTDEVYGSADEGGLFTVKSPYDPVSPYAATKACADHLARAWHRTYGLPTLITNCGNNFGPYQFPEKLIPLMILNAIEGKELPIYGSGKNVRDWIYVDDHVRGLLAVALKGNPGNTYLIGARNERTNIEIVEKICDILERINPGARPVNGYRSLMRFVSDRPGHDFRYAIDPSLTEQELGWRPTVSFEAALQNTVEWYLHNTDWVSGSDYGRTRGRLGSSKNIS